MRVIVHGGAGSPPDDPGERQRVLDEAAADGTAASTPTDAVVAAVRVLERDPGFNAGHGGAVQTDGMIRTDAGLMTDDREVGAACAMPGVEAAVEVARVVKTETPHVLLVGVHAVDLAAAFGIETGDDLYTDRTNERWRALDNVPPVDNIRAQLDWQRSRFGSGDPSPGEAGEADSDASGGIPDRDHDTVGAVATDGDRLAAATSTGGRWLALSGRVGDVPQVGSGFYCTPEAGASATGAGEDIARVTLCRHAVDLVADGYDPADATEEAIAEFADVTDATAGVIVAAADGTTGEAFNSDVMQTAVAGAL